MKSAPSSRAASERPLPFGLAALPDGQNRPPLPLRAIDIRFEVAGDFAEVRLQQEFEYDGAEAVDVVYSFPLPSQASVYECIMKVGDRRVVAKVVPDAEATATYYKARRSGKSAIEVDGPGDNIFELSLGKLQPGDSIRMDFAYVMPLSGEDAARQLRIPVCPGIRYAPGHALLADESTALRPDAFRLAQARIKSDHPEPAVFFCVGKLFGARELESPSHRIALVDSGDAIVVRLDGEVECPDRDFVLTWSTEPVSIGLASVGDPQHVLCSLSASGLEENEPEGREILFLIDSSTSMLGANWFSAYEALSLALGHLRKSDRFQVRLFESEVRSVSDGWKAPSLANRREVLARLLAHHPCGGTNLTKAFAGVVEDLAALRNPVVVVITDGQFGDEMRATKLAREAGIQVHACGIDINVNERVLKKIALRTHGSYSEVFPGQDLEDHIERLMGWLVAQPVHRIEGQGKWELIGCPPSLRNGQSALVAFRYNGQGGLPNSLDVRFFNADGQFTHRSLPIRRVAGVGASILAGKFEIEALLDEDRQTEAVSVACHRNLLTQGAAFIAVVENGDLEIARFFIAHEKLMPKPRPFVSNLNQIQRSKAIVPALKAPEPKTSAKLPPAPAAPKTQPTRAELVRWFKMIARRPGRPRTQHPETLTLSAALQDAAGGITCFTPIEWKDLLDTVLLPWARMNHDHEGRFSEVIDEISALENKPRARIQALKILIQLLPRIEKSKRLLVNRFIHHQHANR
jgi:hypothetical protein